VAKLDEPSHAQRAVQVNEARKRLEARAAQSLIDSNVETVLAQLHSGETEVAAAS